MHPIAYASSCRTGVGPRLRSRLCLVCIWYSLSNSGIESENWIKEREWFLEYSLLLLLLSRFSRVRLCVWPHRWQPTRLCCPWASPGTGVGCHFLLQCVKVKSESKVTQSCLTLRNPMDCSLPGSSIHGIFQARVLEWGAIVFSINLEGNPPILIILLFFCSR